MSECGVCTDNKPSCFSCTHCKYVACNSCTGTWFASQQGTPSCMSCRKALDMSNLQGCFSNSAAVKLFEDKRRESLVRADAAHNLATMTTVMPLMRELKTMHANFVSALAPLQDKEQSVYAAKERLHAVAQESVLNRAAKKALVKVRNECLVVERELKDMELALVHSKAQRSDTLLARMKSINLYETPGRAAGAAGVAGVAAAVAEPAPRQLEARYLKCTVGDCAGVFLANVGDCLVCEARFCLECHVQVEGDHECAPGARATARVVLAQTRGCPRCHTAIMRSEGCAQMMCTNCHCVFDWRTGKEEAGVVHNPYFFNLSADARARVAADRTARGLEAPPLDAPRMVCPGGEVEFDPLCIPFEDPRILAALDRGYRAAAGPLGGLWPMACEVYSGRPTAHKVASFAMFLEEFRHIRHVENDTLRAARAKLADYGESALRMQRLARLAGGVPSIKRIPYGHPSGAVSMTYMLGVAYEPMSDAKYAAQLMRVDTERSKQLERIEILTTYIDTQKDLFRAALMVPPSERAEAVRRIFSFRIQTERQLWVAQRRVKPGTAGLAAIAAKRKRARREEEESSSSEEEDEN